MAGYSNIHKYKRPPLDEYWDYIINRRDLLVPQDIRERKGSFFTPRQWVELSQKYIGDALGDDWQNEYVIWDCAAGTGNLLAGLTNKYNIWASTLDKADVDVIHDRIKNGANLLGSHVFQFDFLNDSFDKLPKSLLAIINNEKRRKKLIIYINPPYAEHGSTISKKHKTGVSMGNAVLEKYGSSFGPSSRELYAQFIIRFYKEIYGCKIGIFSKLKHLQANNFKQFRLSYKAKYIKGFLVPASTFDNVKGNFPIAFQIWDTFKNSKNNMVRFDIYDADGNFIAKKTIINTDNAFPITKWIKEYEKKSLHKPSDTIGLLNGGRTDFQNQNLVFLVNSKHPVSDMAGYYNVYKDNLRHTCIYISVRKCIKSDWINDRDQFLYPNDGWKDDTEFQNDCLAYTLFTNNIQSKYGVNHWIPFTEEEVNARSNFDSHFMTSFIGGKIIQNGYSDLFFDSNKKYKPLKFSSEAKSVFKDGKKLWQYYHAQPSVNVNASLYDIREYFQGRDSSGKMNNKSGDDAYTALIGDLRSALKILAEKIQPKVYEYGFLLK
ncbi:MAG: hypothetical protein FWH41_02985 [Treponema sp.]|nr:hypothetical protein [Treponema sp.]